MSRAKQDKDIVVQLRFATELKQRRLFSTVDCDDDLCLTGLHHRAFEFVVCILRQECYLTVQTELKNVPHKNEFKTTAAG